METCTVLVLTYNHSKTILRALDSVCSQSLIYKSRVLIFDDFSTDNTLQLVENYISNNPTFASLITIVRSPNNKGVTAAYQAALNIINTEYVAILEGDDFWNSPCKLEKQLKVLQENDICVACTCEYLTIGLDGKILSTSQKVFRNDSYLIFNLNDIITNYRIGNFSCAVYRMSAIRKLNPKIYTLTMYDWLFNIAISEFGSIFHLLEPLSIYNYSGSGEWSKMSEKSQNIFVLNLIPSYKDFFLGKYDKQFSQVESTLKEQIKSKKPSLISKYLFLLLPPIITKYFK